VEIDSDKEKLVKLYAQKMQNFGALQKKMRIMLGYRF